MTEHRMSAQERKAAIAEAALPLFARKGFANTTSKELAACAGVSEGLVYKYFPTKESLYAEIQNVGCREHDPVFDKLARLEPSTSTLVYTIYYLVRVIAFGRPGESICWETRHRLALNSFLDDGAFNRVLFQNRCGCCFPRLKASMEAAEAAGDMVPSPIGMENRMRFAHHLASMLAIMHVPNPPVIDYGVGQEELIHQAIWFVLRGLGMKDEAIERYYRPGTLATFFGLSGGRGSEKKR